MFTDMMLDLETLDTTPGSAILSIGAIAFDRAGNDGCLPIFHGRCKPDFSKYSTSYATFEFWMKQAWTARAALFEDVKPLGHVLKGLSHFYSMFAHGATVWCLPGAFDLPIIENAYRVEGVEVPWRYDAGGCLRTVYKLAGITKEDRVKPTVAHDALADCVAQIATLRVALKRTAVR